MDDTSQQFGPGFLPTFLYYFTGMLVITTFASAQILHLSIGTGTPIQLGVIAGLAAGLLGGARHRTQVITLPIQGKSAFAAQLDQVLSEMGYQKVDPASLETPDDVLVYERSRFGKLFSGRVYAQISKKQALIAGRASTTKQLQAALSP